MTAQLEHLEQTNISELAERYRQQGYQVFIKLRGSDLHEFVSNENVDFFVQSENNLVLVAIKPRISKSQSQVLSELNVTEKTSQVPRLYDYPRRDLYDIRVYLARSIELADLGASDSSICLTVFTAEAVMRLVAEHHSIDFEYQSPPELAQTFLDRSLMSQEDCEVLIAAMKIRDAVMYEREKVAVETKFAYQNVEVVQRLLSQAGQVEDEV